MEALIGSLVVLGCCVGGAFPVWTLGALGLKERRILEKQRKKDSLPREDDREQ